MAGTGLDEHHILLHDLSVRALELYRKRGGSVGSAATAICAYSTELSPVCLHAGTTRKLKLDRLGDFGGTDALFALLRKTKQKKKKKSMALSGEWLSSSSVCFSLRLSDFCLYFEEWKFESHLPVFQK